MREIKFRAWAKERKVMIPEVKLFTDLGEGWVPNGYPANEHFEFMQYTGLKDKNGKEIYEGDVIRWNHHKGTVIERLGSLGVMVNPEDFMSLESVWDCGDARKVEAIGNIYENPELLEKK